MARKKQRQRNVQPFHHGAEVIFTMAGRALTETEFLRLLEKALGPDAESVQVMAWFDPEAGDPADLM